MAKSTDLVLPAPAGPIPALAKWHTEHVGNQAELKPNKLKHHCSSYASSDQPELPKKSMCRKGQEAAEGRNAAFDGLVSLVYSQ